MATKELERQCAYCGAFHVHDRWAALIGAILVHRVNLGDGERRVSHGICPVCLPLVMAGQPTPIMPGSRG